MSAFSGQTRRDFEPTGRTMKSRVLSIAMGLALVAAVALLSWQPAVAQWGQTWTISYWPNTAWSGPVVWTDFTVSPAFDWGFETPPAPNMPRVNWSARLSSSSFFPSGIYRWTLLADDDVRLIIDGITYLDTVGRGQSGKTQIVDVPLFEGSHFVQIDFIQYTGAAYLFVTPQWMSGGVPTAPPPPGTPQVPVPSQSSVVTQFGDYTPCIQQNIHQKFCFVSNGAWDAPNYGSIEMEPQIVVWQNCVADTIQSMQLFQSFPPQQASCSKTEAGWYPR